MTLDVWYDRGAIEDDRAAIEDDRAECHLHAGERADACEQCDASAIQEAAQECAESPQDDAADRDYLAACLGREPRGEEWAGFVRARTAALLEAEDARERDAEIWPAAE